MKRIYATDGSGKSAPVWFMYPVLLLGLPFIMIGTMVGCIKSGIKIGFLDCAAEWEDFKRLWHSAH